MFILFSFLHTHVLKTYICLQDPLWVICSGQYEFICYRPLQYQSPTGAGEGNSTRIFSVSFKTCPVFLKLFSVQLNIWSSLYIWNNTVFGFKTACLFSQVENFFSGWLLANVICILHKLVAVPRDEQIQRIYIPRRLLFLAENKPMFSKTSAAQELLPS